MKDPGEWDAEEMIQECGAKLGLPTVEKELGLIRKGDAHKTLLAALIRMNTAVSTEWIASRLQMGQHSSASGHREER